MTLAPEQQAWADGHVGQETTANGTISSWEENDDGTVSFCVKYEARPPMTADQEAALEAQRQQDEAAAAEAAAAAEEERAKQEADAAAAEEERIRNIVREELEAAKQ